MAQIKVEKASPEKLASLGVDSWGTWECDVSVFDWEYGDTEICYLLEGRVVVTTDQGETVEFTTGDVVTFPRGLKCVWNVKQPVRKRFTFT
jgi:uncharacterized protein